MKALRNDEKNAGVFGSASQRACEAKERVVHRRWGLSRNASAPQRCKWTSITATDPQTSSYTDIRRSWSRNQAELIAFQVYLSGTVAATSTGKGKSRVKDQHISWPIAGRPRATAQYPYCSERSLPLHRTAAGLNAETQIAELQ